MAVNLHVAGYSKNQDACGWSSTEIPQQDQCLEKRAGQNQDSHVVGLPRQIPHQDQSPQACLV